MGYYYSNWLYVMAVLFLALIWLIVALAHGEFAILASPTTIKFMVVGALYILSVYLIASKPKMSEKHRLYSWLYSALFHGSLLVYIGVVFDLGAAAMAIGLVETIILMLSLIGLVSCVLKLKKV